MLIATQTSPFMPSIGAVDEALGVHDVTHRDGTNAARQLIEAIDTRQELVSDLSKASGFAVGVATWPVPIAPAERVKALQAVDAVPEARPADEFTEVERRANLSRLGGLARAFGAKRITPPAQRRALPATVSSPIRVLPSSETVEAELAAFDARFREQGRP